VELFERTGANAYQFKNEYTSLYLKPVTGGYSIPGILSGGDSWGDISTNNVGLLEFEPSAYINMGDAQGNLTVNTDYCRLVNVDVRGLGVVYATVSESFLLNANYVVFDNCRTSLRYSSTAYVGFQGSATAAHNRSSKYIDCSVYSIDSNGAVTIEGFSDCENLVNCSVEDVGASAGNTWGYNNCNNLSGCRVYNISSGGSLYGFIWCENISSCRAEILDGATVYAYLSCINVTSCYAVDLDATGTCYGFRQCNAMTGCKAEDVDSSGGQAAGFSSNLYLSACISYISE